LIVDESGRLPYNLRMTILRLALLVLITMLSSPVVAAPKKKAAPRKPATPFSQQWSIADSKVQQDFPAFAVDSKDRIWTAFVEFDGETDHLRIGSPEGGSISVVSTVGRPGVIHNPTLTADKNGNLWCFWGQAGQQGLINLCGSRIREGKPVGDPEVIASSTGSETFADCGVDGKGRVWVTWQSLRRGQADVFCKWIDPQTGKWSQEFSVSRPVGGNWEPRIAFTKTDGAWVAFDSSRGGEFNLFIAHVSPKGTVAEHQLTESPEYEGRVSMCSDADRTGLWITAERGRKRWGKDSRSHLPTDGLNAAKRIVLGRFDAGTQKFTEFKVTGEGQPLPKNASNLNLPTVGLTPAGVPLIAYRYFTRTRWRVALLRFNPKNEEWSQPFVVPQSTFGQDRRVSVFRNSKHEAFVGWPSDRRINKLCGVSGVYLGKLEPTKLKNDPRAKSSIRFLKEPEEYLNPETAPRHRDDHNKWTIDGEEYTLLWGDLHRHTDFSNCRTGFDGCIVEHYRYAYDMAALDFLGTSDHTDVGKPYDPYEWWQTQKLVDVFHSYGRFHSLYAYEREQRFPWGHRNVVFPQRGGPIVYIKRKLYENSPWHSLYPTKPGQLEINPPELWNVLRQYGKPVSVISHTGATSMGTDWDRYKSIDNQVENIVEIFQGARVSYEGIGAPQPTVGMTKTEPYTPHRRGVKGFPMPPEPITNFETKNGPAYNKGVYQRALHNGFKLGVFASSDHISTHVSFGGVYVKELTREGIIEGFNARRTVAATDKIFIEFTVNGSPMGTVIKSQTNPRLTFKISGTAAIKQVTVVRNEKDYQVFPPKLDFSGEWTDPKPLKGDNRYYLRIEQIDGNMGWSSPVWVTME
jgi:hypothetical protein